ncbi:hypothetical protein Tco_0079827 [Tanacetum coccineum]
MMDYGFNFMSTKIHIDNESTICVVKNPVYHSRTKHIEIRHHFIRDCYEKRLIDVLKIHTDSNVVDLLTKGFDVTWISMDLTMDRRCAGNSTHIWYVQRIENKAKTIAGKYEVQTDMSADMSVRGTRYEVAGRGVNLRYEVLFQVAAGQSEHDTWHLAYVSSRRRVSVRDLSKATNPLQAKGLRSIKQRDPTLFPLDFRMFIKSRIYLDDEYVVMTRNYFLQYTQLEILEFRDTLIQHIESIKKSIDERALHKREYDTRVNERQMQTIEGKVDMSKALDASLVDTESSGTESKEQDTSSRSGNDAHADDADIRTIYDEEPMAKVQTTATINVFATGQQHTEQPEFNNE